MGISHDQIQNASFQLVTCVFHFDTNKARIKNQKRRENREEKDKRKMISSNAESPVVTTSPLHYELKIITSMRGEQVDG